MNGSKIIAGLREALSGNWGRATFVADPGEVITACQCPRCGINHRWFRRRPKKCRLCELPFAFLPKADGGRNL